MDAGFELTRDRFIEMPGLLLYLATVWSAGRVLKVFHGSPLVGEIAAGILLGPQGYNIVPFHELWEVLGLMGVLLLVMESGTEIDMRLLKQVGLRSQAVALTGTFAPVGLAVLVLYLFYGLPPFPEGFAVGAILAPTSVGVTAKLLHEEHASHTAFGQLITVAAIADDVFSLLLLTEFEAAQHAQSTGSTAIWPFFEPIVTAVIFLGAGGVLAMFMPRLIVPVLNRLPSDAQHKHTREDFLLICLLSVGVGMTVLASFLSTFLFGAFMGGLAFTSIPQTHHVWRSQMKRVVYWLSRMFFAATIAFNVPIHQMFDSEAVGLGLVLTIVAIAGKVIAGVWAMDWRRNMYVVGWSMVGRGEFSFFIAKNAHDLGLISDVIFAAVVWPLLMSSLIAPFVVRHLLHKAASSQEPDGTRVARPKSQMFQRLPTLPRYFPPGELLSPTESVAGEAPLTRARRNTVNLGEHPMPSKLPTMTRSGGRGEAAKHRGSAEGKGSGHSGNGMRRRASDTDKRSLTVELFDAKLPDEKPDDDEDVLRLLPEKKTSSPPAPAAAVVDAASAAAATAGTGSDVAPVPRQDSRVVIDLDGGKGSDDDNGVPPPPDHSKDSAGV